MKLVGYGFAHGIMPEPILQASGEERLILRAVASLNEEEQEQRMTRAFYNALVMFFNGVNGTQE